MRQAETGARAQGHEAEAGIPDTDGHERPPPFQTLAAHLRRIRSLETDLLAKGNAIRRLEKKIEHLETELRKREEAKA